MSAGWAPIASSSTRFISATSRLQFPPHINWILYLILWGAFPAQPLLEDFGLSQIGIGRLIFEYCAIEELQRLLRVPLRPQRVYPAPQGIAGRGGRGDPVHQTLRLLQGPFEHQEVRRRVGALVGDVGRPYLLDFPL